MRPPVRVLCLLLGISTLHAQETSAPAPEAAASPEATTTNAPRMNEEIHLGDTPSAESLEISPPADSPDPEKAAEISGPLPGDEDTVPLPAVTGTVDVTAKDANKAVTTRVGNLIRITLESNPSAGYNWELRDFDFGAAVFNSSDLVARQGGNVLFGAPGDTVITLQAVKPGEQDIHLVYRRPWEPPDQVAATFSFRLLVEPEATPASPTANP